MIIIIVINIFFSESFSGRTLEHLVRLGRGSGLGSSEDAAEVGGPRTGRLRPRPVDDEDGRKSPADGEKSELGNGRTLETSQMY